MCQSYASANAGAHAASYATANARANASSDSRANARSNARSNACSNTDSNTDSNARADTAADARADTRPYASSNARSDAAPNSEANAAPNAVTDAAVSSMWTSRSCRVLWKLALHERDSLPRPHALLGQRHDVGKPLLGSKQRKWHRESHMRHRVTRLVQSRGVALRLLRVRLRAIAWPLHGRVPVRPQLHDGANLCDTGAAIAHAAPDSRANAASVARAHAAPNARANALVDRSSCVRGRSRLRCRAQSLSGRVPRLDKWRVWHARQVFALPAASVAAALLLLELHVCRSACGRRAGHVPRLVWRRIRMHAAKPRSRHESRSEHEHRELWRRRCPDISQGGV